MSGLTSRWFLGMVMGGAIALSANCALAQITPDGTLPNNSIVTLDGNTFNINEGTRAGGNLFHSFGEFSVPTGGTAFFNNAVDIQNIISRVTGGLASDINGIIRANGTANLFLINPNGIIFGRNASLNIGGSFVATTASAIGFGDRGFFSATVPNTPELLTVNPSAFFFNQIAAAPIQNNSVAQAGIAPVGLPASGLRVPDGQSLLLVGGDIQMDGGRLRAYGGRVELSGLATTGTVGLFLDGNNLSLGFPAESTRATVALTNGSSVGVDGAGGGSIAVNANNLEISGESFLGAGIGQGLGSGAAVAGDITLDATGEIKVVGIRSVVFNNVQSQAVGKGGNITITSASFSLTDGAALVTSTSGQGNAGSVKVRAIDSVTLFSNAAIFSTVESGAVGKGGDININAATLSLTDGAQLLTSVREASNTLAAGRGEAGNVNIDVTGALRIAGVKDGVPSGISSRLGTGAIGNGGNIKITSGSLFLTDDARLSASTSGQGNAGSVNVHTIDSIMLSNAGILSTVEPFGVGNGGDINIKSATLSLTDGAQLLTSVRSTSSNQSAGLGNSGNVNIDVTGAVTIVGEKDGLLSAILSSLETGAIGKGGDITITSGSLSLIDRAQLQTSTFGQGEAGNVFVRAIDSVTLFSNAGVLSTMEAGGVGNGGDINISAATLSLKDGAQLLTLVSEASSNQPAGLGEAGNVNIDVTGAVTIAGVKDEVPSGISSYLGTGVIGKGGDITISSGSLSLTDGAQLAASTFGQGKAGNVFVRAIDSVTLADANIFSTVEAGGVGNGGEINIRSALFSLTDGAQLLTLVSEASSNQPAGLGEAGNVNIDVTGAVTITGVKDGSPSAIFSSLETGAVGKGGNINITSGSLSLTDGAYLFAGTNGQGNAGTIQISAADSVSISGTNAIDGFSNGLFTFTNSSTRGGDININTSTFSVSDGAVLDARTYNDGNGGDITVSANRVEVLNGGQLLSTSSGSGRAGKITVNATDSVIVNGTDATFDSRVAQFPTRVVNFGDASGLFVRSESTGIAGDIEVTSPQIRLDNSGRFIAESASGDGGNIILGVRDLLLLRRGSLISTTAGTEQQLGDGGNITINAPSGFIVAVPNENSDITANAYTGRGGRVQINASGIYGTQFRDQQNPQTSDITASSELGTDGTVELNTPDIDPNSGLINLPSVPVDIRVTQGCYSGGTQAQSSFTIIGRGGLPPNPGDPLTTDAVLVDLITLNPSSDNRQSPPVTSKLTTATPKPIIEATGWVVNAKGEVELIAQAPTATPGGSWQTPINCSASKTPS